MKKYIPIAVMLVGMVAATLEKGGMATLTVAFLFPIMAAFLLSEQKKDFGKTFIDGMQNSMLLTLIGAFLLAGILSQVFTVSGIVPAILWVMSSLHISVLFVPAFMFGLSLLISFVCGTSAGTITTVMPIFLTLGTQVGMSHSVIVGAIVSGAVMGNVLSPLSDVVISTALTTKTSINAVIRENVPLSAGAAAISIVLFTLWGQRASGGAAIQLTQTDVDVRALVLLILPVIMMVLIKKEWNLISTLLACDMAGVLINLLLGKITAGSLLTEDGILYKGITGMQSIILYSMILFWIIEIIKKEGVFETLLRRIVSSCKSKSGAKFMVWLGAVLGVVFTAGGSSGIMVFGPIASEVAQRYGIKEGYVTRTLSTVSAGMVSVLPYGTTYILCLGLAKQVGGIQLLYKECVPMMIFCDICIFVQLVAAFINKKGKVKDETTV